MAVATAKVPQVLSGTGIVPTDFTPAQVEGHYFPNNGGTIMIVFNGSASPITVTAISQLTVEGLAVQDRETTIACLLYTSPSPRDRTRSRMPSSA